jgi:hypothetical protein
LLQAFLIRSICFFERLAAICANLL